MEIIKRKDGTFRYREKIYIEGKAVSKTFKRKTDAVTWKNRSEAEESRNKALGIQRRRVIRFRDFVDRWKEHQSGQLSPSSKASYFGMIEKSILPYFGEVFVHEITKGDGASFQAYLRENGKSPVAIDRVIALLKGILNLAVEWDFIPNSPLNKFPKLAKQMVRDAFWTVEEVQLFLEANKDNHYYSIFLVALNTGMRKGELGGLKWDRIDFEKNSIEVSRIRDRYGLRETTKTSKPRYIPMNQEVRRCLSGLWRNRSSEYVFLGVKGQPVDVQHLYRAFDEAQDRAGMKVRLRFHDLRHTFASNYAMKSGGNLFALKELLGHTSIDMTMRYSHMGKDHLAQEVEKVSFGLKGEFSPRLAHKG